ncbi:quinone oxidoreductase family protein [Pulveribacter suum]|uniref:Quinone oxidoreductase n=1 Tax=Pulveribacter suum TaxID=2116657 RepID=A0A2P1NMJ5_9BURK|nr:zinc-binding alcohol dehydrogenase family protein [Pulveribacter suum]AVP58271.1 quinone oxidoreductase [Pulveribacter suum]
MKAAVITTFDRAPHYGDFGEPIAAEPGEMQVDVLAAGLHHLARGRASAAHYARAAQLPQIAGVDGVGRGSDGRLRYFAQAPGQPGTMAQRTVIAPGHSIELPPGSDPVAVAGAMNPAMASWLALRCRVPFRRGHKVLILGATGSAGRMAVQIARHLGASQVIAAGRNSQQLAQLPALGASDTVALDDAARLGALARKVDVVLDFVWGAPAMAALHTLVERRADRSQLLTWIHIGSVAGESAALAGALLRSANLRLVGSGLGSVPQQEILMELPALVHEIARGSFRIDARAVPLRDVEQVWNAPPHAGEHIVFVP